MGKQMQIPCIVPVLPCVLTGQLQQLQRIEEGLRLQLEQNQQMVIGGVSRKVWILLEQRLQLLIVLLIAVDDGQGIEGPVGQILLPLRHQLPQLLHQLGVHMPGAEGGQICLKLP